VVIQLRPYQSKIIDETRALMQKGCRSILIQSPTGSGKTALTAHMLHTAAGKGMRSLFIVHRRELIKQSTRAFALEGLKHGIISAGFFEDRRYLVQLASVQTLARRLTRHHFPSLIVWDEAHHVAAKSWESIFKQFGRAYHIGLTATPERLDGRGLAGFFKEMIHGPSVQALIDSKFLSPYKLYAPMKINVGAVHTRMGDYVKSELSSIVDRPSITGDVLVHYRRFCAGKRAVIFCVSVAHSKHIAEQFNSAGIRAAHVDGETPQEERDGKIEDFRAGSIKVLANVDLFGEGFDVPAIEAAILLRPTQSLALYLQQVGRALRPSDGKDQAIILDHVGNYERFGLPDEERNWSLEGRSMRNREDKSNGISVKVCPRCFAAQIAGQPRCKFCGFVFEAKPREIDQRDGELGEVDIELLRQKRASEQGHAETVEELTQIGIARGYRFPRRWAHHVFQARQAKKLGKVI